MNVNDPGVWNSTDATDFLRGWVHGILILYPVMLRIDGGLWDISQRIKLNCGDIALKSSNSDTQIYEKPGEPQHGVL